MADLGDCPGCNQMFDKLDALATAAVNHEVETLGMDMRTAKLHVLAAVESWWLDRSLRLFANRDRGIDAVMLCLENVFHEQGIRTDA